MNTLLTFQCSPSTSGNIDSRKELLFSTIYGGSRRYFRLEGLNGECVRNHVGSRGVWEHFPLENVSQFKALRDQF